MGTGNQRFSKYYSVEGLCQEGCATAVSDGSVGWVVFKEYGLALECIGHGLVGLDIGLTSVDNANESKLQGVRSSRKNIQCIGSCIHEIQLSQDSDRTLCVRVDLASKLETVRVS